MKKIAQLKKLKSLSFKFNLVVIILMKNKICNLQGRGTLYKLLMPDINTIGGISSVHMKY